MIDVLLFFLFIILGFFWLLWKEKRIEEIANHENQLTEKDEEIKRKTNEIRSLHALLKSENIRALNAEKEIFVLNGKLVNEKKDREKALFAERTKLKKVEDQSAVFKDDANSLIDQLNKEIENLSQQYDKLLSTKDVLLEKIAHWKSRFYEQQMIADEKSKRVYDLEKKLFESAKKYDVDTAKRLRDYENLKKAAQLKIDSYSTEYENYKKDSEREILELKYKLDLVEQDYQTLISSNLTAIPWLSGMMGDFLTYELERLAKSLDWGSDKQRLKKVASIREIRAEAARITAQGKEAIYQLEYLRSLFPNIDDYLETDYKDIFIPEDISDVDPVRGYLSKEEWNTLSSTEKNQLALDRYIKSRKSKWQIGRDYELAVAYEYETQGYEVDRFGSYMKLEDHGRDLIAKKNGSTYIIQCKYWSNTKTIHEKHIFQLYGSVISYCIENKVATEKVKGIFITNISLSPFAEAVAEHLNIQVKQQHPFQEFPRIKCNIGKSEWGGKTHIYHLPMDAQYDLVKISEKGEFYAFTVKEAEDAGFRRTYKWHGND